VRLGAVTRRLTDDPGPHPAVTSRIDKLARRRPRRSTRNTAPRQRRSAGALKTAQTAPARRRRDAEPAPLPESSRQTNSFAAPTAAFAAPGPLSASRPISARRSSPARPSLSRNLDTSSRMSLRIPTATAISPPCPALPLPSRPPRNTLARRTDPSPRPRPGSPSPARIPRRRRRRTQCRESLKAAGSRQFLGYPLPS
jgi:hypothetical protein